MNQEMMKCNQPCISDLTWLIGQTILARIGTVYSPCEVYTTTVERSSIESVPDIGHERHFFVLNISLVCLLSGDYEGS